MTAFHSLTHSIQISIRVSISTRVRVRDRVRVRVRVKVRVRIAWLNSSIISNKVPLISLQRATRRILPESLACFEG